MPENQPPESDPFADLYGRLPDPRKGARADDAPPSRRAAREARAAGGDAPAAPENAGPDAARRAPDDTPSAPAPGEPAPIPDAQVAGSDAGTSPEAALRPAVRSSDPASGIEPRDVPSRPRDAAPAAGSRRTVGGREAAPGPRRGSAPSRDVDSTREDSAREPALVGVGAASATATSAPGPAASGSLEQLFTGQTTTHDIGQAAPRPSRKRRHVGRWIALAVVVLLIGGIAGGGMALWNTYGDRVQAFLGEEEPVDFEAGQATGETRVTIVAGDTGESVSPKMFEAGVTKASNSLYKYMVDNSVAFTFQPGVYKLQQQMTSEAVLAALRLPENRLDYSVQLREGLTLAQSLDLISEQLGLARADLDAAVADPSQYGVPASTLEGWIFPATYDFDEGVTATQVIDTMVKRTVQSLDAAGVPEADRERILIIASIIEREARSSEDFYKVSRVIENRLQPSNQETFGKLEMDSTVQYGAGEMGSGTVSTSEEARNSDNPWNTYMYPGLPIGPIANAGDLAIDAAMKPADGPWLYFVTVNLDTGETVFTSTYSEHEKAVAQWRAWCSDNPNSGC
ncbi:endolytic transglycosylase MltG [Microbacterium sp. lyk4-40-TSB-66]|uniref:endolytic transglycosylase MltG n=1 Tax=Microbacterium sp. lyk4-40-TSB-66 TaxID=3040294 RepID=UPI002549D070|nr:endolytic transglycosylase MltG [Microbacterium sp. lyk4-40-TSB-66]